VPQLRPTEWFVPPVIVPLLLVLVMLAVAVLHGQHSRAGWSAGLTNTSTSMWAATIVVALKSAGGSRAT